MIYGTTKSPGAISFFATKLNFMHVILLCSTDLRKGHEYNQIALYKKKNQIALYTPPAGKK